MKTFTTNLNLVFTLFIGVLFQFSLWAQDLQWAQGTGSTTSNANLRGQSVITDDFNNVYNVGSFAYNVDFDNGPGTVLLNTGTNLPDPYVAKYNDVGDLIWARQFSDLAGNNNNDWATSIVLDGAGNVYVYGYFQGTNDFDPGAGVYNLTSAGSNDCFVVKLDGNGDFIWANRFGGAGDEGNRTKSMVLDNNGDLVLTGWFGNTTVDFDPGPGTTNLSGGGGFAMKLSTSGNLIWAVHSITGATSKPYELSVDLNGNVFITGTFYGTSDLNPGAGTSNLVSVGSAPTTDIFLQKLNSSGIYQWAFRLGGAYYDRTFAIFTDDLGDIYIGGGFRNTVDFDPGAGTQNLSTGGTGIEKGFVAKYSSSGQYSWSHLVNSSSTNSLSSLVETIKMDNAGNLYFGGFFNGTLYGSLLSDPSFVDIFICKVLSSNGTFEEAWEMGGESFESINDIDIRNCVVNATGFYNVGSPSDEDFDPGSGVYILPFIGASNDHGFLVNFLLPPPNLVPTNNSPICDGTPVQLSETGGEAISWEWDSDGSSVINNSTSAFATATGALNGEVFSVIGTDANGCVDTVFTTVTVNPAQTFTLSAMNPSTCNGSDGTITISGLLANINYDVSYSDGTSTQGPLPLMSNVSGEISLGSLSAATYTITIAETSGCTGPSQQITLTSPNSPVISPITPYEACGGSFTLPVINGTNLSGSQSYYSLPGGPSGGGVAIASGSSINSTSIVYAYDANGVCSDEEPVSITIHPAPIVLITGTNAQCIDSPILLNENGGALVNWNWSTTGSGVISNPSNQSITLTNAGNGEQITVSGTDANGCTNSATYQINLPTPILINTVVNNASCNGTADGSIEVSATGGTAGYNVSWSGISIGNPAGIEISNAGGTFTISTLSEGIYNIVVNDVNGCEVTSSVTISSPVALNITTVPSNVSCYSSSDGHIQLNVTGGTSGYEVSWTGPSSGNPGGIEITTSGGSYTITPLSSGNYTITVTDANGCLNQVTETLIEPSQITIQETIINSTCGNSDGSITTTVIGGAGSYTYLWNPTGTITSSLIAIDAGNYSVTVTDQNGCSTSESYSVLSVGNGNITVSPNVVTIQEGESIQLFATGGTTYTWTPSNGLDCSNCPNPVASPINTTTYIVGSVDSQGCAGSDTVLIIVEQHCGKIFVPTIFSPNEIGPIENNTLCVYGECIVEFNYSIFNRWGELVFETEDIENCWDGTFKGKPLNSGVFVYKLNVVLMDGTVQIESGNVTLLK